MDTFPITDDFGDSIELVHPTHSDAIRWLNGHYRVRRFDPTVEPLPVAPARGPRVLPASYFVAQAAFLNWMERGRLRELVE